MKDVNKVILVGRLGADPIQRQTKTGFPVTQFSVATTRRFVKEEPGATGDPLITEETQWHRVVSWGRQAEACAQYLKKGNSVYVEGSIRSHQYESKEGQSKTSFEIQADNVSFLTARRPTEKSVEPVEPVEPVEMETSIAVV